MLRGSCRGGVLAYCTFAAVPYQLSFFWDFDSNLGCAILLPLPKQELVVLPHMFHHSHSSMGTLRGCRQLNLSKIEAENLG